MRHCTCNYAVATSLALVNMPEAKEDAEFSILVHGRERKAKKVKKPFVPKNYRK